MWGKSTVVLHIVFYNFQAVQVQGKHIVDAAPALNRHIFKK
jgi:hypothetical protein